MAYHYYGDPNFVWAVYLANDIVDPVGGWPMTGDQFDKFIIAKYAQASGQTGYNVINWALNTTITSNIVEVRQKDDPSITVTPDTWKLALSGDLPYPFNAAEWTPVRVYEWEVEQNESKRHIRLINRSMIKKVSQELKSALNESI